MALVTVHPHDLQSGDSFLISGIRLPIATVTFVYVDGDAEWEKRQRMAILRTTAPGVYLIVDAFETVSVEREPAA